MRSTVLGTMIALSMAIGGFSAASAAPAVGSGLGTPAIGAGMLLKAEYGYCERLRRACVYKDERGEWGQGNCRRYHADCGEENHCDRLRRACIHKEERGEEGQGNCRRYHRECGGY
jgi:hypothetical protein